MLLQRALGPLLLGALLVCARPPHEVGKQDVANDFVEIEQKTEDGANTFGGGGPQWAVGMGAEIAEKPKRPPHFPHPPHPGPHTAVNKTIYEFLSESERFTKLFKFVSLNNETIDLLNSTSANLTFFAAPDWAFPHHNRTKKHGEEGDITGAEDPLADWISYADETTELYLPNVFSDVDPELAAPARKPFFKKLVAAVLAYHVLPKPLSRVALAENSTYATKLALHDGSLGGEPLRLRVSHEGLLLKVNLFSKVLPISIETTNGIIHVVNHPLLPPPSVFQELFIAQSIFSVTTSALQRTAVSDALEWRYIPGPDHKKGSVQGNPAVTFFAPTNGAFKKLPPKLRLFLFSPFGERALRKLLQYHTVPGVIIHSDYLHNATSDVASHLVEISEDEFVQSALAERPALWAHPQESTCRARRQAHHRALERPHNLRIEMMQSSTPMPWSRFGGLKQRLSWWARRPQRLARRVGLLVSTLWSRLTGGEREAPRPEFEDWMFVEGNTMRLEDPSQRPGAPGPPQEPQPFGPQLGARPAPKCPCAKPPHLPHLPRPVPVYALNVTLPTLLANHSLTVEIAKYEKKLRLPHLPPAFFTVLRVGGQRVRFKDAVARNGAVHVVDHLLNPFKDHKKKHPHHGHGGHKGLVDPHGNFVEDEDEGWADWEEWLPQWAAED